MFPKQIDQQLIVDQLRLALACVGERDLGNEFDGDSVNWLSLGHWFPQLGGDMIYCCYCAALAMSCPRGI